MDFTDYKAASKYAFEINQGYTAALVGANRCPYVKDEGKRAAWQFGHGQALRHGVSK